MKSITKQQALGLVEALRGDPGHTIYDPRGVEESASLERGWFGKEDIYEPGEGKEAVFGPDGRLSSVEGLHGLVLLERALKAAGLPAGRTYYGRGAQADVWLERLESWARA